MKREYEIFAKSTLRIKDIEAKQALGCDGIEIQLYGELLEKGTKHNWKTIEESFADPFMAWHNIKAIHAPIIHDRSDACIENLTDTEDILLLNEVFRLAQTIGELDEQDIMIIFHSETTVDSLIEKDNSLDRMARVLGKLLTRYSRVTLLIENVTPFRNFTSTTVPILSNNFYLDNVELVKALREKTGVDRIGVLLDTCHQGITEYYMKHIYEIAGITPPSFSLETYMENCAPYLKLMHVTDFKNGGYGAGLQGIPYTEETSEELYKILKLHDKYVPNCPMVLEVSDSDYLKSDSYQRMKSLVDKYYS